MLNHNTNVRLKLIRKISDLIQDEHESKITTGYSGSVSILLTKPNSDVDLTYVIEPSNFGQILRSKTFSEIFPLSRITTTQRIDELENGVYVVYGVKAEIDGINVGLHLCSKDFLESLVSLEEFIVHRFRVHSVNKYTYFMSFDNKARANSLGDDYLIIKFHNARHPDGYSSDIPTLIRRNDKTYFGLHIDRLFTTEFLYDPLDIIPLQLKMQKNIYDEWKKGYYKGDVYDFLHRRLQISEKVINKYKRRLKLEQLV